jgi:environmental stress-induced protein Ves
MQLLKMSDYIIMPWKNGLGTTAQIAVAPDNQWRISAATVKKPNPFSEFKGCQRLLTIWRGSGLLLNDYELLPGIVYKFSGEAPIFCKNLSPEVIDLGVIYHPEKVTATMEVLSMTESKNLILTKGLNFIFCAEGSFQIEDLIVTEGETLRIDINSENSYSIMLKTKQLKLVEINLI